jgi:hypothetical protein
VEKYGRAEQATDDNIIQRMGVACWMNNATQKTQYIKLIAFGTTTVVRQTHLSVTFYLRRLSCCWNPKVFLQIALKYQVEISSV